MDQHKFIRLAQSDRVLEERSRFCPEDQLIAQYFDAAFTGNECEHVQKHVSECGYCQSRLGIMAHLQQDEKNQPVDEKLLAAAKQMAVGSSSRKLRFVPAWAAAAVVVLAISVVTFREAGQDPTSEFVPPGPKLTTNNARQLRSIDRSFVEPRLIAPLEGAVVKPEELVIRWADVTGSQFYRIYIMSDAGDLFVDQRVEGTDWAITSSVELIPGADYFIRVDAYLADSRILSTEHVIFRVGGD